MAKWAGLLCVAKLRIKIVFYYFQFLNFMILFSEETD